MNDSVVDASSVLAVMRNEPGADAVRQALAEGEVFISSVNVTEVVTKLIDWGVAYADAVVALRELNLTCVQYTEELSLQAAALRPQTRTLGLSIGDRACLAVGLASRLRVLTADRAWSALQLPLTIVQIR